MGTLTEPDITGTDQTEKLYSYAQHQCAIFIKCLVYHDTKERLGPSSKKAARGAHIDVYTSPSEAPPAGKQQQGA